MSEVYSEHTEDCTVSFTRCGAVIVNDTKSDPFRLYVVPCRWGFLCRTLRHMMKMRRWGLHAERKKQSDFPNLYAMKEE